MARAAGVKEPRYVPKTIFSRHLGTFMHEVEVHRDVVFVTDFGRDAVVLLSPETYADLVRDRAEMERREI